MNEQTNETPLELERLREVASVAARDPHEFRRGVAKMGRRTDKGRYMEVATPDTVLALIERLERAEAAVERVQAALESTGRDRDGEPGDWLRGARHVRVAVKRALAGDEQGGEGR